MQVGRLATVDGTSEAPALESSTPLTPAPAASRPLLGTRRRLASADAAFRIVVTTAGCIVLVVIVAMVAFLLQASWPAIQHYGFFSFLSSTRWAPSEGVLTKSTPNPYGVLQFIYGTILTAAVAMLIAVPVSVAVGLFIT